MTQEPPHPGSDEREDLPAGLEADLRSLYGTPGGVPERVDDRVMAAARERFAAMDVQAEGPRGGFSVVIRRIGLVGGPLAAAAILALVVWVLPGGPAVGPQGPLPTPGMGRQQAQRMLEERVEEKMVGDRLDFQLSEREEMFAFADELADDAAEGAGALPSESLAAGADAEVASGRADADVFSREAAPPAAPSRAAAKSRPSMREDFDRDGVVDMRDALAMATVLERGAWTMGAEWDLNGDGAVDAQDVDVVALAAVDLERHGEVLR